MYLKKSVVFWVATLFVANVCAAFAVVYSKQISRVAHIELSQLRAAADSLSVEWGRLQLEEGALSEYGRIEETAKKRLGMKVPSAKETRLLLE